MSLIGGFREPDGMIHVSEDVRFAGRLDYQGKFPWNTYYLDYTNGNNNRNGKSLNGAWKTLYYANSKLDPWDRLFVLPSYDCDAQLIEDSEITITANGVKILGYLSSERQWGTPAIHSHGTTTLIKIDAHQVEIGHLAFHMQGAGGCIDVANSGDYWRNHIHDCYFGGNNLALWGIIMGNVTGSGFGDGKTVDAPCTTVERCYFHGINGSSIYAYCGYGSVIRDSSFFVGTADTGITVGNSTTSRPHLEILDNRFSTIDSTNAVGIDVVNTPTAGYFFVDGNRFVNFQDDDKCCSKRTGYMGLNYAGVTAVTITT